MERFVPLGSARNQWQRVVPGGETMKYIIEHGQNHNHSQLATVGSLVKALINHSKKTPTYPWNIPQTLNHSVYQGNPFIFVFWCTWGMFLGSVGIFLENSTVHVLHHISSPWGISSAYWYGIFRTHLLLPHLSDIAAQNKTYPDPWKDLPYQQTPLSNLERRSTATTIGWASKFLDCKNGTTQYQNSAKMY